MDFPSLKNVKIQTIEERNENKNESYYKLRTMRPRSKTGSGGILRVDINKSSVSSYDLEQKPEPTSPQPSIDRLSVTFATEEKSICSSDNSAKNNNYVAITSPVSYMDKKRFPAITDGDDSDEDYSASVTAIIQRRASTRKSRSKIRRTSSPFSYDQDGLQARRRSSCFTTSSGDTAISMEESLPHEVTQEQIFENIRLHKEVLGSVKMQPWLMKRKLKLVQQAKNYIKRHQGALQERLAQSRSTKDIIARWNIYLVQKLQHFRRELANFSNLLIPWESRIKEIESHFGSVVASYFTFLRWLFWVNLIISLVLVAFVAIPELLTADPSSAGGRKVILPEEKNKATNLFTLWDFEGVLKYSPLFYGFYTDKNGIGKGYKLPLAYFMTGLGVYVYSFVATLRKMAENSRMSKLSEKDDECVFSWKLFTGWDYMIGNAETAQNRVASIVLGFKEALLEEAEKKREPRNWKVIGARVMVNLIVLALLTVSAYAVVEVVQRSTHKDAGKTFWRRNEITVVMSLISFLFPMFFEGVGYFEHYHPRKQLRLQLARIMVLNMLNLYSLIFALFGKIKDMTKELQGFKNVTYEEVTTQYSVESEFCYEIYVDCLNTITSYSDLKFESLTSSVLSNISLGLLISRLNQSEVFPTFFNFTFQNMTNISDSYDYISGIDSLSSNDSIYFVNYSDLNDYMNITTGLDDYNSSLYDFYNNETISNTTDVIKLNESSLNIYEIDNLTYVEHINENISKSTTANYNSVTVNYTYEDYFEEEDGYSYLDLLYEFQNITSNKDFITSTTTPVFLNTTTKQDINNLTNFENISTPIYNLEDSTTETAENISMHSIINDTSELMPRCKIKICDPRIKPTTTESTKMNNPENKDYINTYSYNQRKRLRKLCWETMFGQELVKLTVMDLSFTIISIMIVDFIRALFVRVMNNCWCWDLEKKFPQYGDFKIAENILHLVNNQGMVWMGMFFSPGITVINLIKLAIMMYLRSWAVLTCNVPHEVVFRASRSNNFYLALLLTMLFLCVLPVGYAIVWIQPSWHCGPFSNYKRIYHIFTQSLKQVLPKALHHTLDYIASPFIVIPLLVLLILIIYYMISLTSALREANNDLKMQLRRERTEERRKMLQIADNERKNGSEDTPFGKWKKILPIVPNNKILSDKENGLLGDNQYNDRTKDFLAKFLKRAIETKGTKSSENAIDDTDTEQHESLSDDENAKASKSKREKKLVNNIGKIFKERVKQNTSNNFEECTSHQSSKQSDDVCSSNKTKPKLKSISRSSSSKDVHHDSINSNWSDTIPVIKISGTGSSECVSDSQNKTINIEHKKPNNTQRKITHQAHIDIDSKLEEQ